MSKSSTESAPKTANRSTTPGSERFQEYISGSWAERPAQQVAPRESAPFAAARRARISAQFPGQRLIVPAGPARVRSNDTDYPYRAHTAFSHLTGWGSDAVPDSVLVLEPTLHLTPRRARDSAARGSGVRASGSRYCWCRRFASAVPRWAPPCPARPKEPRGRSPTITARWFATGSIRNSAISPRSPGCG